MQLPSNLVAFWQRLTVFQRLSLISILFFLVVLPVAIWLALSPTSPFSRAGGGPITPPVPSPMPSPPPVPTSYPAGSIEGTTTGFIGETFRYSAKGQSEFGQGYVSMHWAKADADTDVTRGESWNLITKSEFPCWTYATFGLECTISGSFTPQEAGSYYVAVVVTDEGEQCSGNPRVNEVPGWTDCGPNDLITLTVSPQAEVTQTFNLAVGYNLVGITSYTRKDLRPDYRAENLLKDLNASFRQANPSLQEIENPVRNIFHYNAVAKKWQVHTLGKTNDDNFAIKQWDGYFVRAITAGTSTLVTKGPFELQGTIIIAKGWSLVSSPLEPLPSYNTAQTFLELTKQYDLDITSIWKYDSAQRQYIGYSVGSSENNFPLVAGEGYWIYNNGEAKQFFWPQPSPVPTPRPSPTPTGIPLPPIPQ